MKNKLNNGSVVKKRLLHKKVTKQKVLKVIAAVMEKQQQQQQQNTNAGSTNSANGGSSGSGGPSDEFHSEFYNTGRIGRRNAMSDILGNDATTTTAGLDEKLSALTTNDSQNTPGSSGIDTTQNQTPNK
ncbi:unnamed protein product [Diamesa hyperborea]